MTIIRISALDQELTVTQEPTLASGNVESVRIEATVSDHWGGYTLTAVFFTDKNETVYRKPLAANACTIPHEVLIDSGTLYIGLRGVKGGGQVKTSDLIKYKIVDGAPSGTGETIPPESSIYEQLLAAYAELSEAIANHESNTSMHVTSAEKEVWNGKANKTDIPTITQEAGESESLVMSQKSVTDLLAQMAGSGGGGGSSEYETVDSVDEMTDTSKQYVLKETGTLWTYGEVTVEKVPKNVFVPANATLNKRLSSSGESASNGMYITEFLEFDASTASSPIVWLPVGWASTTMNQRVRICDGNKQSLRSADWYIASDKNTSGYLYVGQENGRWFVDLSKQSDGSDSTEYPSIKHIRIGLSSGVTASITASDLANVEILFEKDRGTTTKNQWYDTGLDPSSTGSGNYVELLVKVNQNKTDIAEVSKRVTVLETGSDTLTVPTFWEDAVAACISEIKVLQVGKNCITFPFFSDNHTRNGYSGMLIAHVMKECHIPYCFYGGDSISSGYIADEATMIAQDKAFDEAMSYIPNGRFCRAVGNHDGYWAVSADEKHYYTREQVYELFLREESVAQNKHFGDDGTYYYVDDLASKTRFIILNTNGGSVDSTQLAWLQNTALSFAESGWAVVFISHQPISNHYHAGISNAAEVRTAIATYINGTNANKADIVGWYSGHIHRDRIYSGVAVNTSDDSEGAEMPFKQITITSDHTGIAYDDATKHTVANDDKSHAIDFVTINKATRTVNLTRLGIGEDRSYTY